MNIVNAISFANKKKLALFLLLGIFSALLFDRSFKFFSLAQADSAVQFSVDSAADVAPGSQVDLNLNIDPSGAPLQPAALQWDLKFDPVDISSISWKSDGQVLKNANKSVSCANPSVGIFRCVAFGLNLNTISKGVLGTVTVKLNSSSLAQSVAVKLSGLSASDPSGTSISVSSVDATIGIKTSQNNIPPTVSLTSPTDGSQVSGSAVVFSSSASAATGNISSVKFYLDSSILLKTLSSAPYVFNWDSSTVANGQHTLIAQAVDSQGNMANSATVTFNVNNAAVSSPICNLSGAASVGINQAVGYAASGGNGSYSWQASGGNPASQAASSSASFSTSFATAGSYIVQLTSNGQTVSCPAVSVITQSPTVTCSVSSSSATTNSTVTFTAQGGNEQQYHWTVNGGIVTSFDGKTFSTMFSSPGTFIGTVTSGGKTSNCSVQITQPSIPTLSCSVSNGNINVGDSVVFSAVGGTSPYSWIGNGSPSNATGVSFSTSYPTAGNKTVTVTSSDGQSAHCGTIVNNRVCQPNREASLTASSPVKQGEVYTINLSWVSDGGHLVKILQTGASSATVVSSGQGTGDQQIGNLLPGNTYVFQMSDLSCGQILASYTVSLPASLQSLSCSASANSINLNQTAVFNVVGGNSPYSWTGGANPSSGSGSSFATFYTSAGNKTVTVTSSDGQSAQCGLTVIPVEMNQCFVSGNFYINFSSATWTGNGFSLPVTWNSTGNNQVKITQDGSVNVVGSGAFTGSVIINNLTAGSTHTFSMYDIACGMLLTSNTITLPQAPDNNNPPPVNPSNSGNGNYTSINTCVNNSCNYNYYSSGNSSTSGSNNPPMPWLPVFPVPQSSNWLTNLFAQVNVGFAPPVPWFPFQ